MSRNDFEEQFNQRQRTLAERTNVDLTNAFSRVPYAQRIPGENGNYSYSSVIQDIQLVK